MLGIIDYNMGNLASVYNACSKFTKDLKIVKNADDLKNLDKIILPGVGAFDHAMDKLNNSGLSSLLNELVISKKVPVLGICVGMQMLAKSSDEGVAKGLEWIDGDVKLFDTDKIKHVTKIPHMGWNNLIIK